jgi:HlyD family secretion protein
MLKDSLVSQQTYDETFANIKALAQYNAVQAELDDAKNGRGLNNKPWRLVKRPGFGRLA